MQRLGAKALVWSGATLVAAGAIGGTGCTAKKPTELVPGVSSQMVVPKDLVAVSVQVQANGSQVFCRGYQVSPETHIVDLPSTLGVLPAGSPDTVVTITIRGYDDSSTSGDWDDCSVAVDNAANSDMVNPPRILRRSTQTYVDQHTLFLPMPLSYSCIDKDCSATPGHADYTCKANTCVDPTTDQTTLPDFDPTLLDGTGLCFSPSECFPQGVTFPAATVDASQCIYSLPSYATAAAITSGVNVKVFYEDWRQQQNPNLPASSPYEEVVQNAGEEEILNADPPSCGVAVAAGEKANPPCEGFKVLPPEADAGAGEAASAEAQASLPGDAGIEASLPYNPSALRIQLAPGLCDLVHAGQTPPTPASLPNVYHTISDISISGVCQPKLPLLPICSTERNNNPVLADAGSTGDGVCNVGVPLTPAPSVLYLVMDDTSVMHGALGPSGSVTELALSFNDPVFKRTYAGFKYMTYNDQQASCTSQTTPYTKPDAPACVPNDAGALVCNFDLIASVQPEVANELSSWVIPPTEVTPGDAGTPPGIVCYADLDCVTAGAGTYCAKNNPAVPEGGLPDAGLGGDDAGDDGGEDAGLTPGVCTNPQAMDLAAAMRLDVGAYAQVQQFATSNLPPPAVAGVMFFVNRAPETALGTPAGSGIDGGAPEAGTDGGVGIPAYPSPIGALDCPAAPLGVSLSAGTPSDQGTVPDEELAEQQIIESEALNAFQGTLSMQTYFVVLDNDRHDKTALQFFNQVQADLTQPNGTQPIITLDATDVSKGAIQSGTAATEMAAVNELENFTTIISKLGTCLYEIPNTETLSGTSPTSSIQVSYSRVLPPGTVLPPSANPPVVVPVDTRCNSIAAEGDGGAANGWNFDNGRIRICGAACDALRSQVTNASKLGLATGVTPDVPVIMTPLCSGTGASDATTGGD